MTTKEVMQWLLSANSAEREAVSLVMRAVELGAPISQAMTRVDVPMGNGPVMKIETEAGALKKPGHYKVKVVDVRMPYGKKQKAVFKGATNGERRFEGFKYQPKSPLMQKVWSLLSVPGRRASPAELTTMVRGKTATEADKNSVGIQLRKLSERKYSPVKRVKKGRTFLYSVKKS